MISFDNIEKYSYGYKFLFTLMKFAHNSIFYDEVLVIGKENIPKKGEPCFAISNHQNGLMDPLAKLTMFSDYRQPVFIARGDIFKKDFIAKLLKFAKVLPTFRTRDGDRSDIRKNNNTFATAGDILARGGTVIMYPEAQHQHGRYLGDFKKGFPRICFIAEEISDYNLHLKILPVCLHYTHYEKMGSKLLIIIGTPFTFEEFFEIHKTDSNLAYAKLNEKTRSILKEMVLDIEDQENYNNYDALRLMVSDKRIEKKQGKSNYYHHFLEEKKVVQEIDQLKQKDSQKFELLMEKTKIYQEELKKLNFRDWLINSKVNWFFAILNDIFLLLTFPIFLFSLVNNGIIYFAPEIIVKKLKDHQLFSTIRFAVGFVISLVWYLLLFFIVLFISKSILISLVWVSTSILFFKYIHFWKMNVKKVFHAYRYLLLKNSTQVKNLQELKVGILNFFNV